jgi:hypothetical protein
MSLFEGLLDRASERRSARENALLEAYSAREIAGTVVLFTWVIPDGLGDYAAQIASAQILLRRYPRLDLRLVTLFHERAPLPGAHVFLRAKQIAYGAECGLERLDAEAREWIRCADLLVQIPTFYPHWEELVRALRRGRPAISVGEYGAAHRPDCHPTGRVYCMGLHPLEKGILLPAAPSCGFHDLEAQALRAWIVQEPLESFHLHLAYCSTSGGHEVFVHGLLRSLEASPVSLTLVVADLSPFLAAFEERWAPLYRSCRVRRVVLASDGYQSALDVAAAGKMVRIVQAPRLSARDFRTLIQLSSDPVACRGNQSFSEAVSMNRLFFYDARRHNIPFARDLIDLAGALLEEPSAALRYLRLMIEEKEDETIRLVSGERLGALLKDPQTAAGIHALNSVIRERYSFNTRLCGVIARGLGRAKPRARLPKPRCESPDIGRCPV